MDAASAEHIDGKTFYPLPTSAEDALVVMPDVAAEAGIEPGVVKPQDEARVRVALDESNRRLEARSPNSVSKNTHASALASYTVDFNVWPVQEVRSSWTSAYIGTTAATRKMYNFSVNQGGARVSFQGLGYYKGYNGSDFGLWSKYYLINSGTSGTNSVPWGNVSGKPSALIKNTTPYYGIGRWS